MRKASPHSHGLSAADACVVRAELLAWYDDNRRLLPWRGDGVEESGAKRRRVRTPVSPYGVLVSEVMLQQTRVETVVNYYSRWMQKWPNCAALAKASEEELNAAWAGLGYYRRARMLKAAAEQVHVQRQGHFPESAEELKQLPGVGDYTSAAVASIAFGQNVPVVDGNVLRVVSRMRAIVQRPREKALHNASREFMAVLVGEDGAESAESRVERPGDVNQAIMELGATVCVPSGQPKCDICPVAAHCHSRRIDAGLQELTFDDCGVCDIEALETLVAASDRQLCTQLPLKMKKTAPRLQVLAVLVLVCNEAFLMRRRPREGLLAGQWEFPHMVVAEEARKPAKTKTKGTPAGDASGASPAEDVLHDAETKTADAAASLLHGFVENAADLSYLGQKKHIFSHLRHEMFVFSVDVEKMAEALEFDGEYAWHTEEEMQEKGLTTGMRKVLQMYKKNGKAPSQAKRRSKGEDQGSSQELAEERHTELGNA